MNMDIDEEEPAVTHVTSTLTTTHPGVSRLEQDTKQQRQTIVNMEQQIQSLKRSVQELVEYKVQDKMAKQKFNEWQEGLDKQIMAVGQDARENKRAQTTMQQSLANILRLIKRSNSSQLQTANLQQDDQHLMVIVTQHPNPPPQGPGKI